MTIRTRRMTLQLPLEATLLRLTQPFTVPWLMLFFGATYIVGLAFFSQAQSFKTPAESWVDCTSVLWAANNDCGLDGLQCRPFDNTTINFRCPAECTDVVLLNPRTVGNKQAVFQPLVVGGGDENKTYRGDSFICAAAIHAGIFSSSNGGCATLQLTGNFTDFLPRTSNGLTSLGFPTVFPLSFRFLPTTPLRQCSDLRRSAIAFNFLTTCLLFLVLRPKPIVLFWCLVCIGFWHVSLFSQVRSNPPPLEQAFGTFLPALFVSYAFWRLAFRFTLPTFSKAPVEATLLYLAPFWAGVLMNVVFNKVPIDRLLASDFTKRSGETTALAVIIVIVAILVLNQARVIRKTGWLPHYLGWYVLGGLVVLALSQLPGLQLRLHHYILAMILIPGTAFPTRLSVMYQGFLLGMFLNGVAAWGFDSILQTNSDLGRDAASGSSLPTFVTKSSTYNSSIPFLNQSISWSPLPAPSKDKAWEGYSLLVDDVERYSGSALNYSLSALTQGIPHFFRLAFKNGGQVGDFTMPATLWPNGTWVDPLPGPS